MCNSKRITNTYCFRCFFVVTFVCILKDMIKLNVYVAIKSHIEQLNWAIPVTYESQQLCNTR